MKNFYFVLVVAVLLGLCILIAPDWSAFLWIFLSVYILGGLVTLAWKRVSGYFQNVVHTGVVMQYFAALFLILKVIDDSMFTFSVVEIVAVTIVISGSALFGNEIIKADKTAEMVDTLDHRQVRDYNFK